MPLFIGSAEFAVGYWCPRTEQCADVWQSYTAVQGDNPRKEALGVKR